MKFDFVIGNPPYQDETIGNNDTFAPPVYHMFMDAAYEIGDKVELITPARFLFNAGKTPKQWNQKMLNDEHFKVQKYYTNSKNIFANAGISGGVAITYRDEAKEFGTIGIFVDNQTQQKILDKVIKRDSFQSMQSIVITRTAYRLTNKLHEDFPNAINDLSDGHKYDMSTNIFSRLPYIFLNKIDSKESENYYKILGRDKKERTYKFIRREYVKKTVNTDFYKVVIPKAWDCVLLPTIESPNVATTETFITVGRFDNFETAKNCLKYIQTKFARNLILVLKTTQDNSPDKWSYVPLQDFTNNSDIDWSVSIADIDKQLYKKYELSQEEIDFIESKVKAME